MARGFCKWFRDEKGYGFVTDENSNQDFFCHHSAILMLGYKTLKEGQKVEFDIIETQRGPAATNVRPISGETK
jgi:CspA family cold shock protein